MHVTKFNLVTDLQIMLSNVTHSHFNSECNTERGCIDQLYIELGLQSWKSWKYAYFCNEKYHQSNFLHHQSSIRQNLKRRWSGFLLNFSKHYCLVQLKLFHQRVNIILLQSSKWNCLLWHEWLHKYLKLKKNITNYVSQMSVV